MNMAGKHQAIALALLLASLIIISGCTSSKYIPCCTKDGLFDSFGAPLPSPKCYYPNQTLFGTCTLDAGVTGAANCTDGTSCGGITGEEECSRTASCLWNDSQSPKCTGTQARWLLSICQDNVPKSCVNDKCIAMVCGYSGIRPSPPPASQDWDANKSAETFNANQENLNPAMPPDDIILPAVNLQGATCDFNTMNKKLYNKMTSSRGGLWVNSFRFGVGNSFGDYEAARNYFPATDRVCAANPYAQVDRFTVYLNTAGTFCQLAPYYTCNKLNGVKFSTETACKLYCGGGVSPYSCLPGSGQKYACNEDGFAYDTSDACKQKCSIISDTNACTNDKNAYPFLNTDSSGQARYRLKVVSDYMTDTPSPQSSATCNSLAQPTGNISFPMWNAADPDSGDAIACYDYASWGDGPWFWAYDCYVGSGTNSPSQQCPNGNVLGELRTYFDNHAYSSVDFDYEYYVKNLYAQYSGAPDALGRLKFECESGSDCISGSCDTTYYKRPMCKNAATGLSMACGCSKAQFDDTRVSYPSCNLNANTAAMPAYSNTGVQDPDTGGFLVSEPINNYGPMLYPSQSMHLPNGSATTTFKYYFPAPGGAAAAKPTLFNICGVAPTSPAPKKMCIMNDRFCVDLGYEEPRIGITPDKIIKPAGNDGLCHYEMEGEPCDLGNQNPPAPKEYWEYSFNLNSQNPSDPVNAGKFGACKMNGEIGSKPPEAPYLDTRDLGWCAPCTYATLAAQKVDFGAASNPGGQGAPRTFSCYEYRADFNYMPGQYPYGGFVGDGPVALYDGQLRWGGPALPSTQPVKKKSNPSAYERATDGNLIQGGTDGNGYHYYCQDGWHGTGGWWLPSEIPTPSAPYLKEKLTSYLQSNVMPILDEQSSVTHAPAGASCTYGSADPYYQCDSTKWWYNSVHSCAAACDQGCTENAGTINGYYCAGDGRMFSWDINGLSEEQNSADCAQNCFARMKGNAYAPLAVCNEMGGDGAVVHAIGNSTMLGAGAGSFGSVLPSTLDSEARRYLGLLGSNNVAQLDGNSAIEVRASFLKQACSTPPLAGMEILPSEDASSLIGTGDLADPNNPSRGKLHKFFFKSTEPGFGQRVMRGAPDKVPDSVDMLLLDWYPMCDGQGLLPGENEQYEFDRKMEFARAIMANFSKPMLVWKFAFPSNTHCNTAGFLDYMFNNTATMVDAGLIGLIYSDWMMKDGLGYGPETRQYADNNCYPGWSGGTYYPCIFQHNWNGNLSTGLTQQAPAMRGSAQQTLTLDTASAGKGALFCALQLYSKRAIGFIPLAYGQKLYADNQTCGCQECTDYDYMNGACDSSLRANPYTGQDIAQLYCNDGAKCEMPAGRTDYGLFRCADRCLNATACKLCSDPAHLSDSSFCRITPVGGTTFGESMCYRKITDDYWEFLAGLSPSEKCCLQSTAQGRSDTKYTYTLMTGTKQQSEFLQLPGHGEQNIDCGRSPDTSVLTYCNIRVPISQKEIACMRVADAMCAADPNSRLLIAAAD